MEKVLIVEDEVHARTGLMELIESWGYRTEGAANGLEGLEKVQQWNPAIVVTDLKMPRMDGMEMLGRLSELPQRVAVVMLTAQGSIESAVEAMRMGAFDYLPKPVDPVRLRAILESVSRQMGAVAAAEVEIPSRPLRESGSLGPLVGSSPQMRAIYKLIERVAPSNVSVLVTGESGTGKELVASEIFQRGARADRAFVIVDCGAISPNLVESELFGHVRGAFTGADRERIGAIVTGAREHNQLPKLFMLFKAPRERFGDLLGHALHEHGVGDA